MNPSEAFDTLTHHADKRHDFMIRTIGQDALLAAFEMRAMSEDAVTALDDDEFAAYLGDALHDEKVERSSESSPEETYLESYSAFTSRADELFGMIEGYRLTGADEKGLFIDKMIPLPNLPSDAFFALERISVGISDGEITVRKNRQVMGGSQRGITDLPVTEHDIEIAHEALERLKLVNESLD